MNYYLPIRDLYTREILGAGGNLAAETYVLAGDRLTGRSSVPLNGWKRLAHNADPEDILHVNSVLAEKLIGKNIFEQPLLDALIEEEAPAAGQVGFGVSLAIAYAASEALRLPLFRYLGGLLADTLPLPVMKIASDVLLLPTGDSTIRQKIKTGTEIFHTLGSLLKEKGLPTYCGPSGEYMPGVCDMEQVLPLVREAIRRAGYEVGSHVRILLPEDDLFAVNRKRLEKGIRSRGDEAISIVPEQELTVSRVISLARKAQENGYCVFLSSGSADTEETAHADFATAAGARQIRLGSPCRAENTTKYNRLMKIEEDLF